jgi:hypothetical protein
MIETVNDILLLPSWEKYQSADKLDKLRETSRVTSAKYRARQKLLTGDVTRDDEVTGGDATDKDKEQEQDNNAPQASPKSTRFVPPTIEEVTAYCKERNRGVDPVKWWNFYDAKNWYVGKNKMVRWKSAIITWEDKPDEQPQEQKKPKQYKQEVRNGEVVMVEVTDG